MFMKQESPQLHQNQPSKLSSSFEIGSHDITVTTFKDELVIHVSSIQDDFDFIGRYTSKELKGNSMTDFENIESLAVELIDALNNKNVCISKTGDIIMKYKIALRKTTVAKELLIPTKREIFSKQEKLERTVIKLQQREVNYLKIIAELREEIYKLKNNQKPRKEQNKENFEQTVSDEQKPPFQSAFDEKNIIASIGQKVTFTLDYNHPSIGSYQISGNLITKLDQSLNKIISLNPIPPKGRHHGQLRLINSPTCSFMLGIVGQNTKDKPIFRNNREQIYYEGNRPSLSTAQRYFNPLRKLDLNEVLTFVVDQDAHVVHWLVDEFKIGETKIFEMMWGRKLYLFISMYHAGDCVQLC